MRSREISSIIIIQNFAQLKALFKDTWETIPGNCDTFIYLGGNEQSTHKYVSELLGKSTIDKKSNGETKGRQGSSSRNYDVLGRELFTPDEVRKLDNKKCILFIRGFDPIMDSKFIPFEHPAFDQTADGKGKPYVHIPGGGGSGQNQSYQLLNPQALSYYEGLKKKGENIYIDKIDYGELELLTDAGMKKRFLEQEEAGPSAKHRKPEGEDTLMNRLVQWKYSKEQKDELHKMITAGIPKETILTVFYPETDVKRLRELRKTFCAVHGAGS